jgi:hypothetical protein
MKIYSGMFLSGVGRFVEFKFHFTGGRWAKNSEALDVAHKNILLLLRENFFYIEKVRKSEGNS